MSSAGWPVRRAPAVGAAEHFRPPTGRRATQCLRPAIAPQVSTPDGNRMIFAAYERPSDGRGRDKLFLLERVRVIRHGRAVQYAALGVVVGAAAMHCATVIPDNEVADGPVVLIDELWLGCERDQFLD